MLICVSPPLGGLYKYIQRKRAHLCEGLTVVRPCHPSLRVLSIPHLHNILNTIWNDTLSGRAPHAHFQQAQRLQAQIRMRVGLSLHPPLWAFYPQVYCDNPATAGEDFALSITR